MKRDSLGKHLALVFVGAALVYVAAFCAIEHLRGRKGPWHVTFNTRPSGEPSIIISEPRIGISNVTVLFPDHQLDATNLKNTVVFERPVTNVPFGAVRYLDTTFLPGAVVLDLFGHEVQLLPRVLLLDRHEVPWRNDAEHVLSAKPQAPQSPQ